MTYQTTAEDHKNNKNTKYLEKFFSLFLATLLLYLLRNYSCNCCNLLGVAAATTITMGGNSTAAFSIGGYIGGTTGGNSLGGSSGGAVGGTVASDLIPSTSMLNSTSSGIPYSFGTNWEEFSERHARAAATDFAKACINYINGSLTPEEARNLSHRNFGQKFLETFAEHYEKEFFRRRNNLKVSEKELKKLELN